MITCNQLRDSVHRLDELQWRAAWAPGRPPDDLHAEVSEAQCRQVWLYHLLRQIKFLSTDAANLVFATLQDRLSENPELLVFAEGRWCGFSKFSGWLSLETGQTCEELPVPPVETRAYNLWVYYARQIQVCRQMARTHGTDHAASPPAASPEDHD